MKGLANMIKNLIIITIVCAISYFLITGVFIFAFRKDVSEDYKRTHSINRFYSNKIGMERALVVDVPQDSFKARVNMVESAKHSIDISYYSMEAGQVTTLFWSLVFEAADRGVKVRIILDGIANGVKSKQKEIMYAIKEHPNIELKFYDPLNFLKPWTMNNRLHDKYIIVDNKLAILGGRNIGDRFMAPEGYTGEITYDLDVVIYNPKQHNGSIQALSQYFEEVFYSKYAVDAMEKLSKKEKTKAEIKIAQLQKLLKKDRQKNMNYYHQSLDWKTITYPTKNITLIHNPIVRFNKEPWVLFEINQLMHAAKREVFIQSPYIVPSKKMMSSFLSGVQDEQVKVKVLTNSMGTTPNYPAYSVYLKYRQRIVDSGAKIYEYQGENSIHGKAYMIDDDLSLIGSFNLDPRSSFLSTETMIVIHGEEIKKQLEAVSNKYVVKSLPINEDYEYAVSKDGIEERPYSTMKKIALHVVGFFGRFVEYLL